MEDCSTILGSGKRLCEADVRNGVIASQHILLKPSAGLHFDNTQFVSLLGTSSDPSVTLCPCNPRFTWHSPCDLGVFFQFTKDGRRRKLLGTN